MDDISTIESERIASLCRIFHPMDTLFPELENGVSFRFPIPYIQANFSLYIHHRSLQLPLMCHHGSALHTYLTFWCVSQLVRSRTSLTLT
jgi:hypothetical protein